MNKEIKDRLKKTLIVPFMLIVTLIPYSMVIGWNLATLMLFWFIIVPGLTIYFPSFVSRQGSHLLESLLGMIIFYGLMVSMIYDHYQTDYFGIMITSCVINLLLVSVIMWIIRPGVQTP